MPANKFKPGDVVIFNPEHFYPDYWDNLSEADRIRYYGWAGYGRKAPKVFVWMCPINDAYGSDSGHCILVDMDDGHVEWLRHSIDFRKATEEEITESDENAVALEEL